MTFTLMLMFVPVLIVVLAMKFLFAYEITWKEAAIQFVAAAVVVFATWQIGLHSRMSDRQFLNGVVTNKERVSVSCDHSYQCNCTTDSKGNRSCSTCYEHIHDYDWVVETNAIKGSEGTYKVDRVDRQGADMPSRFEQVRLGDPVALSRHFNNYIMASPESLYHTSTTNTALPHYPKGYDYSSADRVIADGVTVPDLPQWNADLTRYLSVLGPLKQANVVIVFTKSPSAQYATDLKNAWLGGKKNDTVVVVGAPQYPQISWVSVFSWSKSDMLNVALRNDIQDQKVIDRTQFLSAVNTNVNRYWVRRPMAEYAYLKESIQPTPTYQTVGWIVAVLMPILLGILFVKTDIFDDNIGLRRFNQFGKGRFRKR